MLAMAIHVVMADVRADSSGIGDAGMDVDAGDTLATASPIVPGNHTGYLDSSVDTDDYYAIGLLAGETVSLVLNVPSVLNYDLQLYDDTDTLVSSSTNGAGSDESIVHSIGSDGIWKVRVHHVSGSGDGSYNLDIILSSGYEKFDLDVGAADDNQSASHLPGISIFDSIEWADPVSGARIASTNASFFLNIYEGTYQENTYYEVSIRYSCIKDVNVSVFMNGIWVHVATLPGMSAYHTYTFLLEPSHLTDCSDLLLGMNVRLRFDGSVTVDSISAASVASFLFAIAMTVVTTVIIQSVFSYDGAESSPTVDYMTFMVMDPNDMEGSLLIAEELGIAPDGDDNSSEAIEWRNYFVAGSIGAAIFATILSAVALGQDLPESLTKTGIFGVVISLVSISLALASLIVISLEPQLTYLSFFLGIIGVATSLLGVKTDHVLTRNVCLAAFIIGGLSSLLSFFAIDFSGE